MENLFYSYLNEAAKKIHQNNKEKGFWDKERNVGEMLMLITSELGEAMEAHRKGRFAKFERLEFELGQNATLTYEQHWNERFGYFIKDTFEDEIADAIIRLLDLSAGLGIDIEKHIEAKVQFNKTRDILHGKKY